MMVVVVNEEEDDEDDDGESQFFNLFHFKDNHMVILTNM